MSYAVQVEQLQDQARHEQAVTVLAMAAGAHNVAIPPGPLARVTEFDEWLISEPKETDTRDYRLLRVLGLRQ